MGVAKESVSIVERCSGEVIMAGLRVRYILLQSSLWPLLPTSLLGMKKV